MGDLLKIWELRVEIKPPIRRHLIDYNEDLVRKRKTVVSFNRWTTEKPFGMTLSKGTNVFLVQLCSSGLGEGQNTGVQLRYPACRLLNRTLLLPLRVHAGARLNFQTDLLTFWWICKGSCQTIWHCLLNLSGVRGGWMNTQRVAVYIYPFQCKELEGHLADLEAKQSIALNLA